MSCYSPLRAVVLGKNQETGKKIIKILKGSDFSYELEHPDFEYINIPCGHCIGCRLKYSRIWADRCMAEASYYDNNIFLTLTYNDRYLPLPLENIDYDSGEYLGTFSPVHPLVKRDVQLFIKRLRKALPVQEIRYFLCGEYGPSTMRPHYHLLLFNCRLDDLKLLYQNDSNFKYYTSDTITKCWYVESAADRVKSWYSGDRVISDFPSAGFHIITSVNWQTCAYVARYIVKKQFGEGAEIYKDFNFPPEFTLMSRKPGIGRQFYEDNKELLYHDEVYLSTEEGHRIIRPNKYYDSLYDIDYPDSMSCIREDRKRIAKVNESFKSNLTSLTFLDRLKSEELVQQDRLRSLHRKEL